MPQSAPPPSPLTLEMSGVSKEANGKYNREDTAHNGRAVWKHTKNNFIILWQSSQATWYVQQDRNPVLKLCEDCPSPDKGRTQWQKAMGQTWIDTKKVKCKAVQ